MFSAVLELLVSRKRTVRLAKPLLRKVVCHLTARAFVFFFFVPCQFAHFHKSPLSKVSQLNTPFMEKAGLLSWKSSKPDVTDCGKHDMQPVSYLHWRVTLQNTTARKCSNSKAFFYPASFNIRFVCYRNWVQTGCETSSNMQHSQWITHFHLVLNVGWLNPQDRSKPHSEATFGFWIF